MIQDFSQSLDLTVNLVQGLLEDLREGEISFAELRTELNGLIISFKDLALNLKNSDARVSEINLKIALLDNSMKQLETRLAAFEAEEKASKATNHAGKWQMRVALITGMVSLLGAIIEGLYQLFLKK